MPATNVAGLMRMTRLCLPHIRDGGHIVNMGSIAGRQAYPNGSSYVASKFAVRGYTYALREDLLGRPIRVTTVDAGLVETDPRSCASAVTRRPRGPSTGPGPGQARRGRRLRPVCADPPAAREHRRDRRQGARTVERRPHRPRRVASPSQPVRRRDPQARGAGARRAGGRAVVPPGRHRDRRSPRPGAARGARGRCHGAHGLFGIFNFLQYGTTAQVGRASGAGEAKVAHRLGAQALWLSLGFGLAIAAGVVALAPQSSS